MQATLTQPSIFTQTARPKQAVRLAIREGSLPTKSLVMKPSRLNTPPQSRVSSLNHIPGQVPKSQVPIQNRIRIFLVHIPIFSIRGQARLAEEIGVSRSTISRLAWGKINPSYRLARAVTDALEKRMGRPLDIREVFSTDGRYPTPSGCALCQCHGCLPAEAWGTDNALKAEWQDARPGDWSMARPAGTLMDAETETVRGKENR